MPVGPQPYLVQAVGAELSETKPSGKPWDAQGDGPADVYVKVTVKGAGSGVLKTKPARNTLTPTWSDVERMTINIGDTLAVRVVDADALVDDLVAELSVTFTGPKRYRLEAKDKSLLSVVVDIKPASL